MVKTIKVGDTVLVRLPWFGGEPILRGEVIEIFLSSLGHKHYDIATTDGDRVVAQKCHILRKLAF